MRDDARRYAIHFSLANDVMFSYDPQLRVISISENVERVLGYRPEELIGKTIQETGVFHADSLDTARENAQRVLSGDTIPSSLSLFVAKDGGIRYAEVSGVPLTRDGRVVGVVSVARDITRRVHDEEELKRHRDHLEEIVRERTAELTRANDRLKREIRKQKRTEESLKERQAWLDSILRAAPIAIGVSRGRVLQEVNDRTCEMTGYTREELIGRSSRILYLSQEDFEQVGTEKRRQYAERGTGYMETRWRGRDGGIIDILLSSTPIVPGNPAAGVMFTALDVTERKRSEDALRRSEEHLRAITANLPGVVFQSYVRKNGEHGLYYVSDRSKEILGLDNDPEGYFQRVLACLKPADRKAMVASLREAVRTVSRWDYETRFVKPTGEVMYVRCLSQTRRQGDEIVLNGILLDVTEQRLAEEALRESEAKYRFLTERMNDIVWTTDMDFRITYVSPSVEKVLGYTPQERMRQNAADMMTPESYARALDALHRELRRDHEEGADPDRSVIVELEYYHRDGSTVWMECVASPIRDAAGNPIGIHGVSRNITDRKQAQEALNESHRHLRRNMLFLEAMLSAIPTPVFFKDTAGRYLGCNQAFSDLFGITTGEIRGKTAYEILPEKLAQVHHGKDLELLQNPKIQTYEWKVRDKDRQMRDVIFGKNVFRDENGEVAGIVGAFIDITELKRAQEELTRHRDSLEEMVRERTEDLTRTYEQLRQENEARKVTEEALRARERDLELQQVDLEEMNSALKVLLDKREEDRTHLEDNIITNIKTCVFPYIEKLKASALRESQRAYLSEIELHLREIASSYIKNLSSGHIGLSPSEIQVAFLIKEGKSSKQIAELLNVSLNTVMTHRFCIRKKTGLKGRKVNLISYLQTLK